MEVTKKKSIFNSIKETFSGFRKFLNSNEIDLVENEKINDKAFSSEDAKRLEILNKQKEKTDAMADKMFNTETPKGGKAKKERKIVDSVNVDETKGVENMKTKSSSKEQQKGERQ